MTDGVRRRDALATLASASGAALAGCALLRDSSEDVPQCEDDMPSNDAIPRAGDWPMPRADPANTGVNPEGRRPGVDTDWSQLRTLFELVDESLSAPIVVDGIAYVTGQTTVYAIDVESGETRMEIDLNRRTRHMVMADGQLLVSTRSGSIVALSPKTGCSYWTADIGARTSTLTVTGNRVFFGTVESNEIGAVSTSTCTEEWRVEIGLGRIEGFGRGGERLLVTGESEVVALDPATGAVQWRQSFADDLRYEPPVVAGGNVYVPTRAFRLIALDPTDGAVRWRSNPQIEIESAPAATDETVYAPARDGTLVALSAETGSETWRLEVDESDGFRRTVLTDTALFAPMEGDLYVVDPETGRRMNRLDMTIDTARICCTPEGVFYSGDDETGGHLYHYPA